ncbi:MAG TPA: HPr-rel-A system PqqD family peptide chaperone [Polyangiaceae bacterium]|nr:HPr-rel-A system PqqD family peptide chaperone [Polyangiaceae bacterium]
MTLDTSRLRDLALSDTGFVFDPYSGHTFTVNPSGLTILRALKQGASMEEAVQQVQDEFEPEGGEDIARDVSDYVAMLRTLGLVR